MRQKLTWQPDKSESLSLFWSERNHLTLPHVQEHFHITVFWLATQKEAPKTKLQEQEAEQRE